MLFVLSLEGFGSCYHIDSSRRSKTFPNKFTKIRSAHRLISANKQRRPVTLTFVPLSWTHNPTAQNPALGKSTPMICRPFHKVTLSWEVVDAAAGTQKQTNFKQILINKIGIWPFTVIIIAGKWINKREFRTKVSSAAAVAWHQGRRQGSESEENRFLNRISGSAVLALVGMRKQWKRKWNVCRLWLWSRASSSWTWPVRLCRLIIFLGDLHIRPRAEPFIILLSPPEAEEFGSAIQSTDIVSCTPEPFLDSASTTTTASHLLLSFACLASECVGWHAGIRF